MTFTALLAAKAGEAISTRVVEMNEQDLMPGDTTIGRLFDCELQGRAGHYRARGRHSSFPLEPRHRFGRHR